MKPQQYSSYNHNDDERFNNQEWWNNEGANKGESYQIINDDYPGESKLQRRYHETSDTFLEKHETEDHKEEDY